MIDIYYDQSRYKNRYQLTFYAIRKIPVSLVQDSPSLIKSWPETRFLSLYILQACLYGHMALILKK